MPPTPVNYPFDPSTTFSPDLASRNFLVSLSPTAYVLGFLVIELNIEQLHKDMKSTLTHYTILIKGCWIY